MSSSFWRTAASSWSLILHARMELEQGAAKPQGLIQTAEAYASWQWMHTSQYSSQQRVASASRKVPSTLAGAPAPAGIFAITRDHPQLKQRLQPLCRTTPAT